MSERFFRLCPNCHRFFYDRDKFINHGCMKGAEILTSETGVFPEDDDGEEAVVELDDGISEPVETQRTQERNAKQAEREKMIEYLRKRGVDMRGERSMRKIKKEYEKWVK